MLTLDSVACADQFTDQGGATIGPLVGGSNGGYFALKDNDAFLQLAYGGQGDSHWTDPVHIAPGNGILTPGTTGVRFRNYVPGRIATVSAGLSALAEPMFQLTAAGVAGGLIQLNSIVCNRLAAQSIPTGVVTTAILTTVATLVDPAGTSFSLNPATGELTLNAGGLYAMWGRWGMAPVAGNDRLTIWMVNGAEFGRTWFAAGIGGDEISSAALLFGAGDKLTMNVFQASGAAQNMTLAQLTVVRLA